MARTADLGYTSLDHETENSHPTYPRLRDLREAA